MLKENIKNSINIGKIEADYNIVIVHLPIKDKKEFIIKNIEMAREKIKELRDEKYEWQI